MNKNATVSARRDASPLVSTTGGLIVHAESLDLQTTDRVQLVDLTDQLRELVRRSPVREGTASLWSLHTTCGVFINEAQAALHADIRRLLEQIVARDGVWLHNDPAHSDCDRMNADAHLRAMLLGHGLTLQITGGDIVLGAWQRVLAAEMDGPRTRSVRVQLMGID